MRRVCVSKMFADSKQDSNAPLKKVASGKFLETGVGLLHLKVQLLFHKSITQSNKKYRLRAILF
ncbi:MAG: hypothetical protein PHO06_02710 [Clostridia bacterium]|nr:hypothetical protein [Clostridia bacterium]